MKKILLLIFLVAISITSFAVSDTENLFKAIEKNDIKGVKKYLNSSTLNNLVEFEKNLSTPLTEAIRCAYSTNNTDILNLILDEGVNFKEDLNALNILIESAYSTNNTDIIGFILEKEYDSQYSQMLLDESIVEAYKLKDFYNTKIIDFVLKNGARINKENDDGNFPLRTAVSLAVYSNNFYIVDFLISKGADINQMDSYGYSVLEEAVSNSELIEHLLGKGANPNHITPDKRSILQDYIIQNGDPKGFESFLKHGADVNYYSEVLDTSILSDIIIYGKKELLDISMKYSINLEKQNPIMASVIKNDVKKLFDEIFSNINDKYEKENFETLAMITAIFMNNKTIFNKLLNDNVSIDSTYINNTQNASIGVMKTPIDAMFSSNSKEMLEVFLENKNVKNKKELVQRYFTDAIYYLKDKHIVELFIKYGADVTDNSNGYPINVAIRTNNFELVKLMFDKGAIVNKKGVMSIDSFNNKYIDNSQVAINEAYSCNNPQIMEFLINKGIEYDKNSLLLFGAKTNSKPLMELALKNKSDINYKEYNISALDLAMENDCKEAVEFLCANGIKVTNQENLLLFSLRNKLENTAQKLIEEGVNLDIKDSDKKSLLLIAAENSSKEIIELLINKGANIEEVDKENNNALILAIKSNNFNVIEYLLSIGLSPNIKNSSNDSAIDLAIKSNNLSGFKAIVSELNNFSVNEINPSTIDWLLLNGNIDLVKLILDLQTDIDYLSKVILPKAINNGRKDIVSYLIKRNISLEILDEEGNTPLILAILNNNVEMVSFLLQNEKLNDSFDANFLIEWAVKNNFISILEILIKEKDISYVMINKNTVLTYAIKNKLSAISNLLIEKNISLNIPDSIGNTPLIIAAKQGDLELITLLLSKGADISLKGENNKSILSLASSSKIREFLLSKGAKW